MLTDVVLIMILLMLTDVVLIMILFMLTDVVLIMILLMLTDVLIMLMAENFWKHIKKLGRRKKKLRSTEGQDK